VIGNNSESNFSVMHLYQDSCKVVQNISFF
jgi:hypothetical protein